MAKKTERAAKTEVEDTTQKSVQQIKSGAPLAEWMVGKPHDLVLAFNPNYDDEENPKQDLWHLLLPIEGDILCVATGYSGYTPKGDLGQLARLMMADLERTLDSVVDMPVITEPRKLKSMHLAITRLS